MYSGRGKRVMHTNAVRPNNVIDPVADTHASETHDAREAREQQDERDEHHQQRPQVHTVQSTSPQTERRFNSSLIYYTVQGNNLHRCNCLVVPKTKEVAAAIGWTFAHIFNTALVAGHHLQRMVVLYFMVVTVVEQRLTLMETTSQEAKLLVNEKVKLMNRENEKENLLPRETMPHYRNRKS